MALEDINDLIINKGGDLSPGQSIYKLGPGDVLSYRYGLFYGINGGWVNEWIISYFELAN